MEKKKIERISELTRISRERALTCAEQEERAQLRAEYRAMMRGNLENTLTQIEIAEPDGSITRLAEKGNLS